MGRPHNPAASITPNIQASVPALQPILLPQKDEVAVQHGLPQVRACKMCIPGEPRPPAGYPLKGEPKVRSVHARAFIRACMHAWVGGCVCLCPCCGRVCMLVGGFLGGWAGGRWRNTHVFSERACGAVWNATHPPPKCLPPPALYQGQI